MSDILVQTSNLPDLNKIVVSNKPSYLIALDTGKKVGTAVYFIATKMDEGARFLKCVGFYSLSPEDAIIENYATFISERVITDYVEMQFPYEKVMSVRSLVYRHKGGK
jgi:hypothetical protein